MNTITYEFPLNERIRIFIRLEQLFQQFNHLAKGETAFDKRAALAVLQNIVMIFRRNDIKSEVLKELDRNIKTLTSLMETETSNAGLLLDFSQLSKKLHGTHGKIGMAVIQNELFQSITQRSAIPGGTCSFDLPEYHHWLEQNEAVRVKNLRHWSEPFDDIRIAIERILNFIRSTGTESQEVAEAGFFQIALNKDVAHQILRVKVDNTIPCYAEISGGKHRCSVRFMRPSVDNIRPTQTADNIPFLLSCCLL
ncbi:Cell division protein ZapD [Patescibacteria group bacterium]|nr:Cell division protein ZapD [Patescibacteria group bacterium]